MASFFRPPRFLVRDRAAPRQAPRPNLEALCYRCGHTSSHTPYAESGSCPKCAGRLEFGDRTIEHGHWGTSLQTTGSVVIALGAQVTANLIICSGDLTIAGKVHAMCICAGRATILDTADIRGGIRCHALELEPGASISACLIETRSNAIGTVDVDAAMRTAPGKGTYATFEIKRPVRPIQADESVAARLFPGKHGAQQAIIRPNPDNNPGNAHNRAVS